MQALTEADAHFACDRLAVACDTMHQLLLGLLESKRRIATDVHAIRKLGKSLRGGFSLLRMEKSAAPRIQSINRLLSGSRDASSRASTWSKLGWKCEPQVADAVAVLLDQQAHAANRRPPAATIAWCLDHVAAARHELTVVTTCDLAEKMSGGLARLERRITRRCQQLGPHSKGDFHALRKALKAWLGAAQYLPPGLLTHDPRYDVLADWLGDENDLATLAGWLDLHGFGKRFAPDLWQTLNVSRRALQSAVIKELACLSWLDRAL